MKNKEQKWETWKKTIVGQEALLSADKEASMFMAFCVGILMAEKEKEEKNGSTS